MKIDRFPDAEYWTAETIADLEPWDCSRHAKSKPGVHMIHAVRPLGAGMEMRIIWCSSSILAAWAYGRRDYNAAIAAGLIDFANAGDREAQEMAGTCYQMGWGVICDLNEAVRFYEAAIAQGSGLAANNLSGIVAYGYTDHPPDRERAQQLLDQARSLGFDHAPSQLQPLVRESDP
jgi:TPR repeat protein